MDAQSSRRTSWIRSLPLLFCLSLAFALPATAALAERVGDVLHEGEPQVHASLLVHPDDDPRSGRLRVGVLLEMEKGWHVYWRQPGESGLPTEVRLELPAERGALGPVEWPAPQSFVEADGLFTTFGYDEHVLLGAVAEGASLAGAELTAHVSLLACRSECVPGEFALRRVIPPHGAAASDRVRRLFAEAEAARPRPPQALGVALAAIGDASGVAPGEAFAAALEVRSCAPADDADCRALAPDPAGVAFFAEPPAALELGLPTVQSDPGDDRAFRVVLQARAAEAADGVPPRLRGVLALRDAAGERYAVAVDVPLETAVAGAPAQAAGGAPLGIAIVLRAMLLALLGGIVLNAMPCVLPVLAIKAFALVEMAHHSRREVWAHAGAYTGGILLSMGVLAAAVSGLRAAGAAVGWGFQFQEPAFVVAITTLLVLLALNLFGVFEVGFDTSRVSQVGQGAAGARRSFFEGLLAVLLATPCTAPFLGTAVGFAFTSPTPVIFGIFGAVGLGLALPFLLLAAMPSWSRWLPRSGPWMLQLRSGLGFALLASAVWLLWVASRFLGADGLVAMLAFLLAVAFATWVFGRAQESGRIGWARGLAATAVILAVSGPMLIRLEPIEASEAQAEAGEHVRVYDPAAVDAELAAGRPVFVVFTADWCITCKVNERLVIADEQVQDELRRLDVAVFEADWTRRDDDIRRQLARFGRAGVPLYLVYAPDAPDAPQVLPEVLRTGGLLAALRDAAEGRTRLASGG